MIEERQPLRAHKISLSNRSLGVITGVKDVVSFDLNEIILDTDQGLLMIKGKNLHVKKLLVEMGEVEITGKIDTRKNNNGSVTVSFIISVTFLIILLSFLALLY